MIRPIRKGDIARCAAWYNWYIEHSTATFEEQPLSAEAFSERVDEVTRSYPWLILETDGAPVGYAYLDRFNPKSAYRFTADVTIYLDPEETGKGYGRQLFQRLIEIAEADHYQTLVSLVTKTNTPSIRMHEAFGFRKLTVLEQAGFKHGAWLSTILYEKRIGNYPTPPEEVLNLEAGEVML